MGRFNCSLLAGGLWVFLSQENLENAEFAIAGAILDARENRSGASDKVRGRGRGEREKNCLPKNPSPVSRRPIWCHLSHIPYQPIKSLACDRPSIMFCKHAIQNKLT